MRRLHGCRRSLTFLQKRCSSVVSPEIAAFRNEEQNSLYPPIKPKYPPGTWGSMEPGYAWVWHQSREDSLGIPTVKERIAALCEQEMKQLEVNVKDVRPRTLEFKKYVTKTHVLDGWPEIYQKVLDSSLLDEITVALSPIVCNLISMEIDQLERNKMYLRRVSPAGHGRESEAAHLLLRTILCVSSAHLSKQFPHLFTMQFDENVNMAAVWDRHGIKRTRRKMVRPDYFKLVAVDNCRVKCNTIADFVLRSDKPLPEFVGRDSHVSSSSEVPEINFEPCVFGQRVTRKQKGTVEAGHVWGDPCEFGLLSVLNTEWSYYPETKYGEKHAQESRLAQGLMTSFVWLAAQAHNQGFNCLVDLSYPLTTQTVLTDGQNWRFLAYQLNTLELWKDNDGNKLSNLCWASDEKQLFAEVKEGKVHGFNPEVLRQLIAFLALAPADRPYRLRPTLPPTAEDPKLRDEYIPVKKEEVVVVEKETYVVE